MRLLGGRASDSGIVLCILLLGVIAAQPLLRFGLPLGLDTLYHVQRTASLLRSWQAGVAFPRWSADLAYGFGYPLYSYYAPLAYYFTAGLSALGLTATQAVTWVAIAFYCLQAIGAWLWLREHAGSLAAYVGSISYTLAPYTIGTIIGRGALAEHVALGIAPFVLWSIAQLSRAEGRAQARWWLLATLLLAALWLSHNVSAILLSIPVGGYLLYCWLARRQKRLLLLAPIFAALIVAFFWMPIFVERSSVQLDRLRAAGWANYRHHFLELNQLLAWPEPADRLLVFQSRTPELNSLVLIVCLIISLVSILNYSYYKNRYFVLVLHLALFLLSLAMMSRISIGIWEYIDVLRFLQFPWRFHSVATLCIGLLSANVIDFLEQHLRASIRRLALATTAAVWLGFSAAFVFARQMPADIVPSDYKATAVEVAQFEHKTTFIGTTTSGEYLPSDVSRMPPFDLSVFGDADADAEYSSASRLAVDLSTPELTIHQQDYSPYRYTLRFSAPSSATLVFRTFYFPGWQATLNGMPVSLSAHSPHGLLRLDAPAGTHEVEVFFGSTPLRSLAEALSLAGFGATIALAARLYYRHRRKSDFSVQQQRAQARPTSFPWESALLASLIVLGAKTLWVDQTETPFAFTRFDGRTVRDVNIEVQKLFGDGLVLIGADMPEQTNPSSGELRLTLFWRAARALNQEYSTSVQIIDSLGMLVGQSDNQHPGEHPTTHWPTDRYGRDQHIVTIYPGTPPGTYRLLVKGYPYGQPQFPLPVYNESGSPIGTEILLGSVALNPEPWHVPLETLKAERILDTPAGDPIALVAFNQPADRARPGTQFGVTFFWQAQRSPLDDIRMTLHFVGPDGRSAASQDFLPVATHPTPLWRADDLWRGTHRFVVPRTLASGSYTLTLQIPPTTSLPLSSLFVEPVARTFEPPNVGQPIGARFLEAGDLSAAEVPIRARSSEGITIRLIWKATRETDRAYKVFVHIVDAQGNYTSGNDSEPANWSRPTTSWVEGEYVLDEHTLNAPLAEGAYEVRVGLYDAESGRRLPLVSGETFITLPQRIQVNP